MNKSLLEKMKKLEIENSKLNDDLKNAHKRLEDEMSTKFNMDKLLEKSLEKEKSIFEAKLNELNISLSNLKLENSEKDRIINELNNQILDNKNKKIINDQHEMQTYLHKSEEIDMKKKNLNNELENKLLKERLKEYEKKDLELENELLNKKVSKIGGKVILFNFSRLMFLFLIFFIIFTTRLKL
jgi:hypothetical protein